MPDGRARPDTPRFVQIDHAGQLGNRMLQYMLARAIQTRVADAQILGVDLPEWGIVDDSGVTATGNIAKLSGHTLPLEETIKKLGRRRIDGVLIRTPSMRVEYYQRHLRLFRQIFRLKRAKLYDFDNSLVMHVRLNRIYNIVTGKTKNMHRDYPVVPLGYWEHLIRGTRLQPIFVGEFGDDPVSDAFRARFAGATFVRHDDAMDDFRILWSATHVAISPSSFSWLASWLSPYAQRIVLPVLGILNPLQRTDIDMLPVDDPRYDFFGFPVEQWIGSPDQVQRVIHDEGGFEALSRGQVIARYKLPPQPVGPAPLVEPPPPRTMPHG